MDATNFLLLVGGLWILAMGVVIGYIFGLRGQVKRYRDEFDRQQSVRETELRQFSRALYTMPTGRAEPPQVSLYPTGPVRWR